MAERIAIRAALALALLAGGAPLLAQKTVPAKLPANPRDLSGVWMNDNTLDEQLKREGRKRLDPKEHEPSPVPEVRPLTPEYAKIFADKQAARAKLAEGAQYCQWPGMPRILTYPYPMEILHTPGRVTMIFEAESQVRRIFLDRTQHLPDDDLDPSFNGDSIGHWEGNTLVVDTIGFNTDTIVGRDLPHSDRMRIAERLHYVGPDLMVDEVRITDPLAFTKPITQTVTYRRHPDWRIREYSCEENNRDAPGAEGQRSGGTVTGENKK